MSSLLDWVELRLHPRYQDAEWLGDNILRRCHPVQVGGTYFSAFHTVVFDPPPPPSLPTDQIPCDLIWAGCGGVGMNILHRWARWGVKGKKCQLYDPDEVSWHNVFRLPLPYFRRGMTKVEIAQLFAEEIFTKVSSAQKKLTPSLAKRKRGLIILAGANLSTRLSFARKGIIFLYAGHQGDQIFIHTHEDYTDTHDQLLSETYGQINLVHFHRLMDQLSIQLLQKIQEVVG